MMLCHAVSCCDDVVLCAVLCYAVLCCAVLCCVGLCFCCVVLCAVLCFSCVGCCCVVLRVVSCSKLFCREGSTMRYAAARCIVASGSLDPRLRDEWHTAAKRRGLFRRLAEQERRCSCHTTPRSSPSHCSLASRSLADCIKLCTIQTHLCTPQFTVKMV